MIDRDDDTSGRGHSHDVSSGSNGQRSSAVANMLTEPRNRQRDLDWGNAQSDTLATLGGALRYGKSFVRRSWLLLLVGFVVGLLLMSSTAVIAPPRYVATTTLLFDTGKMQIFSQPSVVETNDGIEDQLQVLQSNMIAEKILTALGPVADEEFPVPEKGRVERLFGPTVASIIGINTTRTDAWREQYRLSAFQKALKVKRIPGTKVISLSIESDSGERAALIANLVTTTFLETQLEDKRVLGRRALGWMSVRVNNLQQQVAEAQGEVNRFRALNSFMEGSGYQAAEVRFTQLTTQVADERNRASELTARLNRVETVIAEYSAAELKPALSEFMNNGLVTKLREQLYELSNRKVSWLQRHRPDHEAIQQLDRRIREIHSALLHEHQRLAESYRSDLQVSKNKLELLSDAMTAQFAQLQAAHTARITLRELESKAAASQALHDSLLKRHSEALEQDTFPIARGRVLNEAVAPLGKDYKKPIKVGFLLFMFGVGLGFVAAVLRDLGDSTFRGLDEVERELGVRLLAVLPVWQQRTFLSNIIERRKSATTAPGELLRQRNVIWASDDAPRSQFAESLRMLTHQVDIGFLKNGTNVIGLTSAQPADGASTLAAAMAVTMATSGRRTLLIDGDLRNPTLTRRMAPGAVVGLVDIISGKAQLKDALRTDPTTGLTFLPAPESRGLRSDQLLSSAEMERIISEVRTQYDCVIVDLPSLVPLVDVIMTTGYIDSYISVVAWGASEKESTRRAYEHSTLFRKKLIGVVLNKVDLSKLHLYDHAAAQWFNKYKYRRYLTLDAAQDDSKYRPT